MKTSFKNINLNRKPSRHIGTFFFQKYTEFGAYLSIPKSTIESKDSAQLTCSTTVNIRRLCRLSMLSARPWLQWSLENSWYRNDNAQNTVKHFASLGLLWGKLLKQEGSWPSCWFYSWAYDLGEGAAFGQHHEVCALTFCPFTPWQSHFPQPEPPQSPWRKERKKV